MTAYRTKKFKIHKRNPKNTLITNLEKLTKMQQTISRTQSLFTHREEAAVYNVN